MTDERDDFGEQLAEVEALVADETAEHTAAEQLRLSEAPVREARIQAIHDREARRLVAAQERLATAQTDAQHTAIFLESRGIAPPHQTAVEDANKPVNLWYVSFKETGTPKDPPQESPSHPLKSESMIFEGTTVRVFGVGLDEAGNLYRLGGEYDIKAEYKAGYGGEEERDATRQVVATKLDDDVSVLLELMPPTHPGERQWPEYVLENGGQLLFQRTQREPEETDESYQQRLDQALEEWQKLLVRLVKSHLHSTS